MQHAVPLAVSCVLFNGNDMEIVDVRHWQWFAVKAQVCTLLYLDACVYVWESRRSTLSIIVLSSHSQDRYIHCFMCARVCVRAWVYDCVIEYLLCHSCYLCQWWTNQNSGCITSLLIVVLHSHLFREWVEILQYVHGDFVSLETSVLLNIEKSRSYCCLKWEHNH